MSRSPAGRVDPADQLESADLTGLAGLATALTGDPERAADLVGATLAHAAGRPGSATSARLRTELVRLYLRDIRFRGDHPVGRAALALTVVDGLTRAEAVAVLDRPAAAVTRALSELTAPPEGPAFDVAAQLIELAGRPPEGLVVRRAVELQAAGLTTRRRRRTRRVLLIATVVAVLAVGSALQPVLFPPPAAYVRPRGAWVQGFSLDPPAGWRVTAHSLTSEGEQLDLAGEQSDTGVCSVYVGVRLPTGGRPPDGEAFVLRGRPAVWVAEPTAIAPYLWWNYGTQAQATLSCLGQPDPRPFLTALARSMVFVESPVRVPMDLRRLGDSYRPQSITISGDRVSIDLAPRTTGDTAGGVSVTLPASTAGPVRSTVSVGGETAEVYTDGGRTSVCRTAAGRAGCLSTAGSSPRQQQSPAQLAGLLGRVRFATDPADRSTWFDAQEAVPG